MEELNKCVAHESLDEMTSPVKSVFEKCSTAGFMNALGQASHGQLIPDI